MQTDTNNKTSFWGILACYTLALVCLVGGIYTTNLLVPLIKEGKLADAEVVGIDVGAKSSKRAILQFITDTGSTAVSHDMFEMMIFRFNKGDRVTVLYNPLDVSVVTVDLGLWIWQQPVIFFFGFILLSVLEFPIKVRTLYRQVIRRHSKSVISVTIV